MKHKNVSAAWPHKKLTQLNHPYVSAISDKMACENYTAVMVACQLEKEHLGGDDEMEKCFLDACFLPQTVAAHISIPLTICYSIILLLGLSGNFLTMVVILKHPELRCVWFVFVDFLLIKLKTQINFTFHTIQRSDVIEIFAKSGSGRHDHTGGGHPVWGAPAVEPVPLVGAGLCVPPTRLVPRDHLVCFSADHSRVYGRALHCRLPRFVDAKIGVFWEASEQVSVFTRMGCFNADRNIGWYF